MSCNAVHYVFAHVSEPYILPLNVGFPIGPLDTSDIFNSFIILETHYNNPTAASNLPLDSSGVRVYYTNTLRPNHGGSITLGDAKVSFPSLTNGASIVHRQSNCPSVALGYMLGSGPNDYQTVNLGRQIATSLNVFASFLHMHRLIAFFC